MERPNELSFSVRNSGEQGGAPGLGNGALGVGDLQVCSGVLVSPAQSHMAYVS